MVRFVFEHPSGALSELRLRSPLVVPLQGERVIVKGTLLAPAILHGESVQFDLTAAR